MEIKIKQVIEELTELSNVLGDDANVEVRNSAGDFDIVGRIKLERNPLSGKQFVVIDVD